MKCRLKVTKAKSHRNHENQKPQKPQKPRKPRKPKATEASTPRLSLHSQHKPNPSPPTTHSWSRNAPGTARKRKDLPGAARGWWEEDVPASSWSPWRSRVTGARKQPLLFVCCPDTRHNTSPHHHTPSCPPRLEFPTWVTSLDFTPTTPHSPAFCPPILAPNWTLLTFPSLSKSLPHGSALPRTVADGCGG